MSELRFDPLSGRWVVISQARAARPDAFELRRERADYEPGRTCPFCPGNTDEAVSIAEVDDAEGNWQTKIVANLYPAFEGEEPFVMVNRGPVFTEATAGGTHEVVVLSRSHDDAWADLPDAQVDLVMAMLKVRLSEHATRPNLRYTQLIVNSGREAGASLEHPHGQLLGMSFVPRELAEEQARFSRFVAGCLLCTAIEAEETSGRRTVCVDEHAVVVSPYWASVPYELLVLPRHHDPHLHKTPDDQLAGVGRALARALRALRATVGNVAYNLVVHSAPFQHGEPFHWHIHVLPKAVTRAGFEMGTGVAINIVPPERAAEDLRSHLD